MPDHDDLFDDDGQEALAEFDRLTQLLSQHVVKFAEDEDISDEMLSPLLLRIAITSRMVGSARPPSRRPADLNSISTVSPRVRGRHLRNEKGCRSVHRTHQGVDLGRGT
jgi:hypothetical protein